MKLPFIQLYPADYIRDTRVLSLAAKGGWTDVLMQLHGSSTRGTMTLPVVGWARVMGATVEQTEAVIAEIDTMRVGVVTRESNGDVTISNRRMLRESISREKTRLRVHKHRRNKQCNASGNVKETGDIPETIYKETSSPPPNSPPAPSEGDRFVSWFVALLDETGAKPKLTPSAREAWADCYDRLLRLDGRTKEQVKEVCRWARNDAFWRKNFLSPMKLREKKDGITYFDLFLARMGAAGGTGGSSPASSAAVPKQFRFDQQQPHTP